MKTLIALAMGAAGGYAYCRIVEAKAQGVPWETALRYPRTPIVDLKMQMVLDPEHPLALLPPATESTETTRKTTRTTTRRR